MRPPLNPTPIPSEKDDSRLISSMKSLYNCLIKYREPKTDRILVQVFMCLPSRKEFPEYFDIIEKPIALHKIRERIEKQQYIDIQSCLDDMKLMFSNCKFFNEDDSQIHKDAVTLESILMKHYDQLLTEHGKWILDNKDGIKDATETNVSTTKSPKNDNKSTMPSTEIEKSVSRNTADTNGVASSKTQQANSNHVTRNNSDNALFQDEDARMDTGLKQEAAPSIDNTKKTFPRPTDNNNGISTSHDETTQQSDSTTTEHHEWMDSTSNLSPDINLYSTPVVEKCSLNTRRGRHSDAPKRRLLTGYIIYASEMRKHVIDKHPNQNFGDISRLVGNDWKALTNDVRIKYDQRALAHNARVREKTQRDLLNATAPGSLTNGLSTKKLTKRRLAKLAKEQMRQHHLSFSNLNDSSSRIPSQASAAASPRVPDSSKNAPNIKQTSTSTVTAESSTQTTPIRFVEPPARHLVYSKNFRKYVQTLQVPNDEIFIEERPHQAPPKVDKDEFLGAGHGRHESTEAALWALRDFMLQDAVTMRRSIEPYL